jgi:SAM-dependent methyltransferase
MTFPEDAFDFTFIREAFHHLARPYAGVYEMVRVARKAAILFEPADIALDGPLRGVNASIFHSAFMTDFEVCGFQFRLNAFEMVKTAMALNLPAIAFKGWNDPYTMPLEDNVREEYLDRLRTVNEMGARGERLYNLTAVAFLKRIDEGEVASLQAGGYTVMRLQQYVDRGQCV